MNAHFAVRWTKAPAMLAALFLLAAALTIAGCGGTKDGTAASAGPTVSSSQPAASGATVDDTTTGVVEISKADAARWVKNWCELEEGMSRERVIQIMGEPTEMYDGSGGEQPQVNYDGYGYGFTVFLNVKDDAYQFFAQEPSKGNPPPDCDLGTE